MLRRSLDHMRHNVVAYLALFVALGGTAYAANTVRTGDIVDNEVFTTDVRDDTLGFGGLFHQDLAAGSVRSSEVLDSSIRGVDIQDSSLTGSDISFGSIQNDDIRAETLTGFNIADNSLRGTDIDESTLSLPPTTTATFAGQGNVPVTNNFTKIVGKTLPAGSYAIAATANIQTAPFSQNESLEAMCELRNTNGAFIGGGRDRRPALPGANNTISLSMNGGVQVPASGGEVGLYCRYAAGGTQTGDGQMMIIRLDGFF